MAADKIVLKTNVYMRKTILLLFVLLAAFRLAAQNLVASFDTLTLPGANSFYLNSSAQLTDLGFNDAYVHFPYYYDTSWGGFWSHGFSYSNITDSVTSGPANQYAAKPAGGYNSSPNYVVVNGSSNMLSLLPAPMPLSGGQRVLQGCYVTNSTYAYNSMRDGDAIGKKFGGASGTEPDWFKLTVRGFANGVFTAHTVEFYLADFRDTALSNHYIVQDWQWLDLSPLGAVDSVKYELSSSDVGQWGMNTPAYFCMDDFTTVAPTDVTDTQELIAAVYPNPAKDAVFVRLKQSGNTTLRLMDLMGRVLQEMQVSTSSQFRFPLQDLAAGTYLLQVIHNGRTETTRLFKQ